ncbi:unnamed protein product, partial [Brassica rapa subsp. narinosa]
TPPSLQTEEEKLYRALRDRPLKVVRVQAKPKRGGGGSDATPSLPAGRGQI